MQVKQFITAKIIYNNPFSIFQYAKDLQKQLG